MYLKGEMLLSQPEPDFGGAKTAFTAAQEYAPEGGLDGSTAAKRAMYLKGEMLLAQPEPDLPGAVEAFRQAAGYAPEGGEDGADRMRQVWMLRGEKLLAQENPDFDGARQAFANAGGESNEGMIKCARKYSRDAYGDGRSTIVTLWQSFHGRTVTTLAATGQDVFHQHFFPFTEGFRYAVANDVASLEEALAPGDVCAVMVELVQGEGGVLPLEQSYVDELARICHERDILLCVDEVQTGIGRTGSLFCFQQYGITPDLVTFAKGIAGGLPMGGLLAGEKCERTLGPGMHATTFGGNPIAAAAARVVLQTIDDELLAEVRAKGEHIRKTVLGWEHPHVTDVRGRGLMIGIALDVAPRDVVGRCIDEGVLVLTAGSDALRLLPPLTISWDEVERGLAALKRALG
jgi:acetylornithine/N-succinyldiaminopimelate aminotransferase